MSLDVNIIYQKPKKDNYFLSHPYSYSGLSKEDLEKWFEETEWSGNITHNLGEMASKIPLTLEDGKETDLYHIVWRPEEVFDSPDTTIILGYLITGIEYMITHRLELLPYEASNGWGTYNGFLKFLLNYKQACEDNPGCLIEADR